MREPRIPLAPIKDPIRDEDGDGDDDWYYGANAGGLALWFGIYNGYKLHQVPLHYVDWCHENLTRSVRLQSVISSYLGGIINFAEDNYGDFIVPFGKKHQGQTIVQCRDKPWFEWLSGKQDIREKYPYFLRAVDQWLAHPRRQGVQRDVGELLDASKYQDDIELMEGLEVDDEELTQEDIDFLDDSSLFKGVENDGSESYHTERGTNSGANTSFEMELLDGGKGRRGNEADTSPEATFTNASDSEEEVETRSRIRSRKRSRTSRSNLTTSESVSPTPMRITKSKFIREAQYSDDSDDSDDVRSFIDDGPIRYESSASTAESGASSPEPLPVKEVKRQRKRIMKRNHSEDGNGSQAGPASRIQRSTAVRHSKTRKSQRDHQGAVNTAFYSDNSNPPEVHTISSPSKSPTKRTPNKGKETTRRAKHKHSEGEYSPQARPSSRILGPATTWSAKTKKSQHAFIANADAISDSNSSDLPEVRYLSSPSKLQPKKTPKSGKRPQRKVNQGLFTSRGARKLRKSMQSDDASASASLEESPRAARRRLRNAKNKDISDATSSYRSNSDKDEDVNSDDSQEDKKSMNGRNEIDDISSEVSAKFSTESSHPKSVRKSLYPSPPLTEVVRKRRKKAKAKQRTKDIEGFVIPDEEDVDESDDFRTTSTVETSTNPRTPEPTTPPRYSTRASSRKAASPGKMTVQNKTPAHRCYVELPPRQHLLKKMKTWQASIGEDTVRTSRAGTLKRSRNVIMSSSEDEYSEGTKRPRLSPIHLPRRPKFRRVQSDEETVDGSVDGETVIRGSSLGLSSSSPFKSYERLSPSKPHARQSVVQADDHDDVFLHIA